MKGATRKNKKRIGGSKTEETILKKLQSRLEILFKEHKPIEVIQLPFLSNSRVFYLSIVIEYNKNIIKGFTILITNNKIDPELLVQFGNDEISDELADSKQKSCYLASELHKNRDKPWGNYVNSEQKGIKIKGDYGFSLGCSSFQGTGLTKFLFIIYFFILKIQAHLLKRDDYIITDFDTAMMYDPVTKSRKSITNYVVERLQINNINTIMETPLLYYERYGFIYPEKREFFSNLLKYKEAFVLNAETKSSIYIYYIDLATKSFEQLFDEAKTLKFRLA